MYNRASMNALLKIMKKPRTLALLGGIAFLFLAPFSFAQERVSWPTLQSDEDLVKFLFRVHSEMPDLFPAMVDYGTDYMAVLQNQQRITETLGTDLRFQDLLRTRENRTELDIEVRASFKSEAAVPPVVESSLISDYANFLQPALLEWSPTQDLRPVLKTSVLRDLNALPDLSVRAFTNVLVLSLEGANAKTLFQASPAERIELLKSQYGNTLGSKLNRASALKNLPALAQHEEFFEGSRSLELYQTILNRDLELSRLYGLIALTSEWTTPFSRADLEQKLSALQSSDLAVFENSAELQNRIHEFLSNAMEPALPAELIVSGVQQTKAHLEKPIKTFSPFFQSSSREAPVIATFHVVEEPVQLAVVGAGCWGNDCNTKNLAAYNRSPFIKAASINRVPGKSAAGRVDTALVKVGETPYLYLNTINGVSLSREAASYIIDAYAMAAPQLKVAGIILPTAAELEHNMNFVPLREAFHEKISNRPEVNFTYPDAELRRALGPYANSDIYHSPEKVFKGVIYTLPSHQEGTPEIKISVETLPEFNLGNLSMEPSKVIAVALELEAVGQFRLADRFSQAAHLEEANWNALNQVIQNSQHLPVDSFFQSTVPALEQVGLQFDPKFKNLKREIFYSGLIRAPDAFTGAWSSRAVDATLTLLKKGADRAGVAEAIREHLQIFEHNEVLLRWLDKTTNFDGPAEQGPAYEAADALGDAGFNLDWAPAIRDRLYWKLNGQDRYHRVGAASVLYRFHRLPLSEVFPLALNDITAHDGTIDFDSAVVQANFHEFKSREPDEYISLLMNALRSSNAVTQKAALHAISYTEVRNVTSPALHFKNPKLLELIEEMSSGGWNADQDLRDYSKWIALSLRTQADLNCDQALSGPTQ
jgi:hypothetical protein